MESLRKSVQGAIGSFLYKERFQGHDQIEDALLITIDEISDYYEEGQQLFPEVLVANNLDIVMQPIPHQNIKIGKTTIESNNFKLAIKQCAPLCKDGWVMYINLEENEMTYGLISAELSSISLTLLDQLKSQDSSDNSYCTAYIRRNTASSVEVQGRKNSVIIEFSLKEQTDGETNHINRLSNSISQKAEHSEQINIAYHIERLISDAARSGHGNLIGVIDHADEALQRLKGEVSEGVYLEKPIDLCELLILLHEEKSSQSDFKLRLYVSVVKSMLNNDGITIFNNKAQLIGYHLLIPNPQNSPPPKLKEGTGTRSKAFDTMAASGMFVSGFFKSQDGRERSF
ncbi:hypothetical protein MTX78_20485 [Hymenobacter tibetensis]|uniref:Uncharacterized protein n=1 Tax=Hymenobacter tibetensis TaxID=497967 RepID=A0ABY4CW38_9BACT|nr:hypothetical protein [Hymenobacter tibetensis]UOG74485.1 hypothetical protein MTX78_20485 [Hymenobacter tibetensis]